jgi:hypothetical protein
VLTVSPEANYNVNTCKKKLEKEHKNKAIYVKNNNGSIGRKIERNRGIPQR